VTTDARRNSKLSAVRALLAKAERTEFPEEARALTSKAQELIVRYSLTEAQLQACGHAERDRVVTIMIEVKAPYRSAKGLLLSEVARANNCQVIAEGSRYHLAGFSSDAERIQLLFTSLLVQAAREMLVAYKEPWMNTKSFRHSFLIGYATEVGTRLVKQADAVVGDPRYAGGSDLLPVLADRRHKVDRAVQDRWGGRLGTSRVSYRTDTGYRAGQTAARRADVSHRRLRSRRQLVS
jgi:Protein of unknown function (DUF2786)